MRKIAMICGLGALTVGTAAWATTLCAEDDVIVIALDPQIKGTGYRRNTEIFEWSVPFPYGAVWGITTCVDTKGIYGVAVDELKSQDGTIATGGERTGGYCWCKMVHPAVSNWVYYGTNTSISDCMKGCATGCAIHVNAFPEFRAPMFGSTIN